MIRSPGGPDVGTSVDVIFVGVEYLAAPRHLGEIIISQATQTDAEGLEKILQKQIMPSRVWLIESSSGRFLLVAAGMKVQEHHGDIFDSPFARSMRS